MADFPRQPIYVKYWPPPWGQTRAQNFYQNIVFTPAKPPINQVSWPVPSLFWPPFRQYLISQPLGSPLLIAPVEHCAFQLGGFQDSGFQVCYDPFHLHVWPLAQRIPFRPQFWLTAPPLPLVSAVTPFSQDDWPAPRAPYRVYAEARSAFIPLLHSVQPPIAQSAWPLPVQPYRVYAQSSAPPTALVLATPFNLEDWPLPVRPPIVYSPAVGANVKLLHSIQPPMSQTDWPQPIRPYIVRSTSYGTATGLLTPPSPPIAQSDWPYPRPPYRVYAEVRRADIRLLHSVQPPNAQYDWPLPPRAPTRGLTWINALKVMQLTKPFNQTDWPLPKQIFTPTSARTWIQAAITAAQVKPVSQTDWPLPIRPPVLQARAIGLPQTLLSAVLGRPFNQFDWPRPQQPQWPILARSWINQGILGIHIFITPDHFDDPDVFYPPTITVQQAGYNFPVGHSLRSDYSKRSPRDRLIIGRR